MRALENLEKDFALSKDEMGTMITRFHREMDRGLSGRPSSLKMLPAYIGRPTGNERGRFMALDLGGTNFRVLALELKGRGITSSPRVLKYALHKKDITSTGKKLFAFLARAVKKFLTEENITPNREIDLGFTFSFPVRQKSISGGTLVAWTKGFRARGVEGRDVVRLLESALAAEGIRNVRITALANDTVGTLVTRSYSDRACNIGVIIGTGTNACYCEKIGRIKKVKAAYPKNAEMIINIEWGNFNKLKVTRFDAQLDRASSNPGAQWLEKMVSGMYLGEICRFMMIELITKEKLFSGKIPKGLSGEMRLTGEYVSGILADDSENLTGIRKLLRAIGINETTLRERMIVKKICAIVAMRAARIGAAAIAAVATKTDRTLIRKHTIAIDGSVYEKLPEFSRTIRRSIREIFGPKAGKLKLVLTKDGSGKGAAIIAAVAVERKA